MLTKTKSFSFLTLRGVIFASGTLIGCASDSGSSHNSPPDEEDNNSIVITQPVTLQGVIAYGQAAAFANICTASADATLGIVEYCTLADAQGEFDLNESPIRSGLVRADIARADGTEVSYYSLFNASPEDAIVTTNVNEVTHQLTLAYLESEFQLTPEACFADNACLTTLAEGVNTQTLDRITANTATLLGDLWPLDQLGELVDPFTEDYVAIPSEDPVNTDGLIELLDFTLDENNVLIVSDVLGTQVAAVPLAELNSNPDTFLDSINVDTLDETETEPVLSRLNLDEFQTEPPVIGVRITVDEIPTSNLFQSPSTINIGVLPSHTESIEFTGWEATLISPDGIQQSWDSTGISDSVGIVLTDGIATTTLITPGVWTVTATVTDINGLIGYNGRQITIIRGPNTEAPATYGAAGSCQPLAVYFDKNSLNICIETMDGGFLNIPPGECDDPIEDGRDWIESRCRTDWQMNDGGTFLGTCTNEEAEVQVYHYLNPERPSLETAEEASVRIQSDCEEKLSVWTTF